MEIAISNLGTAVPDFRQSQEKLSKFIADSLNLNIQERRALYALYRATGIHYRYSVLDDYLKEKGEFSFFPNHSEEGFPGTQKRMDIYKSQALPLALRAIENASLEGDTLGTITHVITVSCTGMYAPGLDIELIAHLKLNPNVQRTAVNFMGCYGVLTALKLAYAFCHADALARVLIVSVELCSLHLQPSLKVDHLLSGALFSDGAAAFLVERHQESLSSAFILKGFHSELLNQSQEAMAWNISDFGFDIVLTDYVSALIKSGIQKFSEKLFKKLNIIQANIQHYAIHPGGKKILQACEKALNIGAEANHHAYIILKNYGNMSSATIGFILHSLWKDPKVLHQDTIFSCAFGPGLTLESMILTRHYV